MFCTGSDKVSRFSRDKGTVWVGNKTSIRERVSVSITKSSNWMNGSTGSSMSSLGIENSWLIYRNNGTIGMTHKTIGVAGLSMCIRKSSMSIRIPRISYRQPMSTEMRRLGSSNHRGISRNNCPIGKGHQMGGGDCYTSRKNLKN